MARTSSGCSARWEAACSSLEMTRTGVVRSPMAEGFSIT